MPFITTPIGGPGDGVFPTEVKQLTVNNKSATTRTQGDVMTFPLAGTVGGVQITFVNPQTGATTNISQFPGGSAGQSEWNCAINVSDASYVVPSPFPVFVVLDTTVLATKNAKVAMEGIIKAKVNVAGATAAGAKLAVDTTNLCLKVAVVGDNRVVGILLTAIAGAGTSVTDVLFNGWTGFTGITIT